MEGIPQNKAESRENYNELVGRITVFRHGDTEYTNQYPDLTDEGKWKLEAAGKSLKDRVDEDNEDVIFLHSPSIRAKASMAHLLHGMEKTHGVEESDVEEIARSYAPLRSVKRYDLEETQKMIDQHTSDIAPDADPYVEFDRAYVLHEDFENSPHWEARSKVEHRANRLLRQTVAMLIKNHSEDVQKTPHIVAVSHFETLNNLAVKIFNLDVQSDPLYARGEQMTFEVRGSSKAKDKVLVNCGFRGEERTVWFDVRTGEITPANP